MITVRSRVIFCPLIVGILAGTTLAIPTLNGWDTDVIYVLRGINGGTFPDGEIRKLNEAAADPTHSDLGRFGADLVGDGKDKSICFSNSPAAGVNSPAGARMFGVQNFPEDVNEPNTTSFHVFEFASTNATLRHFYGGLAGGGTGNAELNGLNGRSRVGNIRYNPAKNTIAVACNIAKQVSPTDSTLVEGTQKAMVYEFALPDWVASPSQQQPTLVQRYELPGRSTADNGNINTPPAIDFDNVGNMYVAGQWYDANGDGFRDIIRFSTLGKNAGLNTYVPSITGPDAPNLLINGDTECNQNPSDCTICNNNIDWKCGGGAQGMAVRTSTNQLVVLPTADCVDQLHTLIYDLTQRVGGGAAGNLVLAHRLPLLGYLPRISRYAQRDEASQKIYMGHRLGDCGGGNGTGGAQNFMYLNNDSPIDSVTQNVGYFLSIACNPNCNLNKAWDAASPPPVPGAAPLGACCQSGHACASLTQSACSAGGGLWQGANTTCGQFPCEGACCNGPCNACQQGRPSDCVGTGKAWEGYGTVCGQVACPLQCATPSADANCDGDVDIDDFAVFQRCYNPGEPIPSTPYNCACFDRATPAGQIDHFDFEAIFNSSCAKGAGVPAGTCP